MAKQKSIPATFVLSFIAIFIALSSSAQQRHSIKTNKNKNAATIPNTPNHQKVTYKIIVATGNTWCYDIFKDNKMLIHQPSVPGMTGNRGFNAKADAEKVAKLVAYKIQHNQMPPTVTKNEMDSLKVK